MDRSALHRRVSLRSLAFAASVLALLLPRFAHAQDNAPPESEKRVIDLSGQVAASWAAGNTRAFVLNAGVRGALRLNQNQLTLSGLYNHQAATTQPSGAGPDDPTQHYSDRNMYARIRYDRSFLGDRNALFVGLLGFRDSSSGFDSRVMTYGGYERIVADKPGLGEIWVEAAYRAVHEDLNRDEKARADGLPGDRFIHGPMAMVGGKLELTPTFVADVGVELMDTVGAWSDVRLNLIANAMSFIGKGFAFGTNFTMRYLHDPIGARAHTDTSLQAVLAAQHSFGL